MGIVSESRQEAGKRQPHPHGGNWKGLVRECLGLEHDLRGMNTVQVDRCENRQRKKFN